MDPVSRHRAVIIVIISLCFIFTPSSSSLSLPRSSSVRRRHRSPSALIARACNSTENPTFCRHALTADNRTATVSEPAPLAVIALDLAVDNSTNALLRLKHISRRLDRLGFNANSTMMVRVKRRSRIIKVCIGAYRLVDASFRSAREESVDGDFLTANYDAKCAGDYAAPCGEALVAGRVKKSSLLPKMQAELLFFSDIGFELTVYL